jgi:hypothetical protein
MYLLHITVNLEAFIGECYGCAFPSRGRQFCVLPFALSQSAVSGYQSHSLQHFQEQAPVRQRTAASDRTVSCHHSCAQNAHLKHLFVVRGVFRHLIR